MAAVVAATLTTIEILGLIGITTAQATNAIRDDMLTEPEGIGHLNDEDAEGIQSACSAYAKRPTATRFTVTRVQQKRLISLMYWVKDKVRLGEPTEFADTYVEADLRGEIEAAQEREVCRKEQKRKGEAMLTDDFQVKLESAIQWERWEIELNSHLKMIIGANGIALSYVIRDNSTPDHSNQGSWEEKARLAAPHSGSKYTMDKLAVHNIIARNISETSHAYTYIKPTIRQNDGRTDIVALKARYQNPAMQDMYVNEAKKTLETISYKNERAMKFEIFSGKFQNAINVLSMYGRAMHNEDIVDLLWPKIQSADLAMFLSSLKVDYRRNRQVYTDILQELATQIPVSATQPFSPTSVSDIHRVDERNKGKCPASGAHMADGTLYTGSYPYQQWNSKEVMEHHEEIRAIRKQGGGGGANKGSKMKRKAAELKSQISELETTRRRLIAEVGVTPKGAADEKKHDGNTDGSRAGTAFGGRAEKAAGK